MNALVRLHYESETENCICVKLPSCGGIVSIHIKCPEHGLYVESIKFHTHPLQVDQINRGRHIA
jgi:hypothetical protein